MDPIQKPSLALGDLVGLFAASASNPDLSRAEQALAAQMAVLARHVQYVGAGLSRFVREHRALDKTVVAVIESVKAIQDGGGSPSPAKQDRPPAPEVDTDADPETQAIEQWSAKAQQEADEEAAAAESVPVPAEVPTPPVVRKAKAQRGNGRQA